MIKDLVRDKGQPCLDGRVFPDPLAADKGLARVGTVDARQMPDHRGLARAVGPHQAIDRSARHMQIQRVQRLKVTEALFQRTALYH